MSVLAQLNLLDYTPTLEPQAQPLGANVAVEDRLTVTGPACAISELFSHPREPILIEPLTDESPYAIADFVEALPRPTSAKGSDITTSFKGRVGIVVSVDPATKTCKVHWGIKNHPSTESWRYLQKSDRAPCLWPAPLDQAPPQVCWWEWRWLAEKAQWFYTGNMGLTMCNRHAGTHIFPADIDPNIVGARP